MPVLQRILLIGFFCSIITGASAGVTEINPSMGETEINELLNRATPGDTLLFRPGTYRGPFVLSGVHGSVNQPVVITGASKQENDAAVIDEVSIQDDFTAVIDGEIYIYGNTAVSMPESEDGWPFSKSPAVSGDLPCPFISSTTAGIWILI